MRRSRRSGARRPGWFQGRVIGDTLDGALGLSTCRDAQVFASTDSAEAVAVSFYSFPEKRSTTPQTGALLRAAGTERGNAK